MIRRRTRVWLLGLFGGTVGGIGTAVSTWLSLAVAGNFGVAINQLTLDQLGVVMLAGGVISAAAYLVKSPMPNPKDDTKAPFPAPAK